MKNHNPYQLNLMRIRGFSDGAGARPMNSKHMADHYYEAGYIAGQKAKREYSDWSAKELNVSIREIVPLQPKLVIDHIKSKLGIP